MRNSTERAGNGGGLPGGRDDPAVVAAHAALVAAVLRRAVQDAKSGNGRSVEAAAWLASDDCAALVELLGVDAGVFRARLAGVSMPKRHRCGRIFADPRR